MADLTDRVRNRALQEKIMTMDEVRDEEEEKDKEAEKKGIPSAPGYVTIQASAIDEEGNIIPSLFVGTSPTRIQQAETVLVSIDPQAPLELEGMHDIYLPVEAPHRLPIPILRPEDHVGTPFLPCAEGKIRYIVEEQTETTEKKKENAAGGEKAEEFPTKGKETAAEERIAGLLQDFLRQEMAAGRLPDTLFPLAMGSGPLIEDVLSAFSAPAFHGLTAYTDRISSGLLSLIEGGHFDFVSGTALALSAEEKERFFSDIHTYKKSLLLRPQDIALSPEVLGRLGVIALNPAMSCDIYGNVDTSLWLGAQANGKIGTANLPAAQNGSLSIVCMPSVSEQGRVSNIVPLLPHTDLLAADVDVLITEQGVADLRGKQPLERALEILTHAVHPEYQPVLRDYMKRAVDAFPKAVEPQLAGEALSLYARYLETATMQ